MQIKVVSSFIDVPVSNSTMFGGHNAIASVSGIVLEVDGKRVSVSLMASPLELSSRLFTAEDTLRRLRADVMAEVEKLLFNDYNYRT
jgi:hypothetical protein